MLLKKRVEKVPYKLNLNVDKSLVDRIKAVEEEAKSRGLGFDLDGEVIKFISGQVTRAETILKGEDTPL